MPSSRHQGCGKYTDTITFDVETNGQDPRYSPLFRVLGVSYASTKEDSDYLAIGHKGNDQQGSQMAMRRLQSLVGSHSRYVFHNAKYDLIAFERLGINLWDTEWYDTMLMAHMVDENLPNKGLDYLGRHYFNEGKEITEEFDNFIETFGWEFVPEWMIRDYAIQDAKLTLKLFHHLLPECVAQGFIPPSALHST